MDAREISQMLARDAERVCFHLLPSGKRVGREFIAGDVYGGHGDSLKVHLEGTKAGVWADFASDDKGDLLDLWRLSRRVSLPEALKEARAYLGVQEPSFHPKAIKNYTRPTKPDCRAPQGGVFEYLTEVRKLTPETIQTFQLGATDAEIVFASKNPAGELVALKWLGVHRPDGKKQIRTSKDTQPCLFGWQTMGPNSRQVFITEGELDAMSLHQYGFPALSVPFGAGNHAWVEYEWENLERFDTIYLTFDQDEPGQKGALEVAQRLGLHRCKVLELPAKDANQCLQEGVSRELLEAFIQEARTLDPAELKSASVYVNAVIEAFYPTDTTKEGLLPPWPTVHNKIRFRPDELSIWTGINGHGKSQMLGHAMLDVMRQSERVCIASMEIKPARLLYRLTRQATTTKTPTEAYIRAVHEWFGDRLWLFDVVGNAKADRILEVFAYARKRYGITTFVIDSLMKCGIPDDDYRGQKAFVESLCDFKNQYNCHVHLVAHSRKGEGETNAPGKMDVKGSGTITDLADNVFSVWRNKAKEDSPTPNTAEPDAKLKCSKQRNGEWEGTAALWFDRASWQYLDENQNQARSYVPFNSTASLPR